MYHAIKYLKVENGIIALANVPRNYFDDSAEQIDISFKVTETCVLVSIRDLNIPIWDDMLEYMTKNRNITVYSINNLENNIESPVLGIEIPEHSMV